MAAIKMKKKKKMMMMEFDVNVGDDDLSSGLSPVLNGFTGLCGEGTGFQLRRTELKSYLFQPSELHQADSPSMIFVLHS